MGYDPDVDAIFGPIDQEMLPLYEAAVPAIFACRADDPAQRCLGVFGTGTLIQVAERCFLVTAKHVFDAFKRPENARLVPFISERPNLGEPGCIVMVDGEVHLCPDPWDIAIRELPGEAKEALPGRRFLSLSHFDLSLAAAHELVTLYGYPCSGLRVEPDGDAEGVVTAAVLQWVKPYQGGTDFPNYDSRVHLLLRGMRASRDDPVHGPTGYILSWHGISGCSIWRPLRPGVRVADWKLDDAQIVAVQTSVYRDGAVIKAARWWGVATGLWQRFPDLRPSLRLHGVGELMASLQHDDGALR